MKWDTEISKLSSNLHNRIHGIRKLTTFTNFHTRLQFTNGFIIGKLRYMLPLYMNSTKDNIGRLHKVLMTAARAAIGSYCCKKSTLQILSKCNWIPIQKLIIHSAINVIHSVINIKKPIALLNLINIGHETRPCKEVVPKYIPKGTWYLKFYMVQGLKIYNKIPNIIKIKSNKQFKIHFKKWILTYNDGVSDTMD